MQTIDQPRVNNLSQLMDELIAGVPTFLRVTIDPDGRDVATADSGRLEGTPTTIRVTFADDIAGATVQAVIDAHVPGQSVAEMIAEAGREAIGRLRVFVTQPRPGELDGGLIHDLATILILDRPEQPDVPTFEARIAANGDDGTWQDGSADSGPGIVTAKSVE